MKISVFGRHPVPQPGFMGVMSLYEAKYFSLFGHDVTLQIPFENREAHTEFLRNHRLRDLDELDKFGGRFRVAPVFADDLDTIERADVCIYQSYAVADWEPYWRTLKGRATVFTKNFPKFVTGPGFIENADVTNQLKAFHLVACSLQEDVDELATNAAYFEQNAHKIVYVPRGADDEILGDTAKLDSPPVIGIDTPNSRDERAISHYFPAIARLRDKYPGLEVVLLGNSLQVPGFANMPFARFDSIYRNFFNRISCYLTINYAFSEGHTRSSVQQRHPAGWTKRAIYEVQNVEAQMAGAPVIGHPSNVIPELFSEGVSARLFERFDDPDEIFTCLDWCLEDRKAVYDSTRGFALSRFRWEDCIRKWEKGIERFLASA